MDRLTPRNPHGSDPFPRTTVLLNVLMGIQAINTLVVVALVALTVRGDRPEAPRTPAAGPGTLSGRPAMMRDGAVYLLTDRGWQAAPSLRLAWPTDPRGLRTRLGLDPDLNLEARP